MAALYNSFNEIPGSPFADPSTQDPVIDFVDVPFDSTADLPNPSIFLPGHPLYCDTIQYAADPSTDGVYDYDTPASIHGVDDKFQGIGNKTYSDSGFHGEGLETFEGVAPYTLSTRSSPPGELPPLSHGYARRFEGQASQFDDEDSDAEAESESDGDATDDEYLPSLLLSAKRPKRYARLQPTSRPRSGLSIPLSPSPSLSSSSSNRSKRSRMSSSSGNTHMSLEDMSYEAKINAGYCPYPECEYKQQNRRGPDLKRHISTHEEPQWLCCGAPLGSRAAGRFMTRHPDRVQETKYQYFGEDLVGGCQQWFTRRDAYKRHLDNNHNKCVGDLVWYAKNLALENKKRM